jgi:spore coat-associated protein N
MGAKAVPHCSPVLITCVVTAVVAVLAMACVKVNGAVRPPEADMRLASGSLSLTNSLNGAAVLTGTNLKPGDTRVGLVTVVNTGSLDGAFSLAQAGVNDSAGPFGGRISDRAQLTVEQIGLGGSLVSSVYSGALSGLGTRQLGTLQPGDARAYRFTVVFPNGGVPPAPEAGDNLYQSSSFRADYVWTATNDSSGSAGGGGGGAGFAPSPLTLKLGGKKKQRPLRKRKLIVDAVCSTTCTLTSSTRFPRARRAGRARLRGPVLAPAGTRKRLTINLPKKAVKSLRRVLKRRKRAQAVVSVTATAGALRVTAKRTIAIKR